MNELLSRLVRYTGRKRQVVESVLAILTFGSKGVRNPDIAIQPLVEFRRGACALSPFVWINSNAERNLCVLLNQMDEQRRVYAQLTQQKEALLRNELTRHLEHLNLDFRSGVFNATDIDLAIIDRVNRSCLCVELKWFIEPAEIREVQQRSEELTKGVAQAKQIMDAYERGDQRLLELLGIGGDWDFAAVVGSYNWIGHFDVQDVNIPIVKPWQLADEIRGRGSLVLAMNWLRKRAYLPVLDRDFAVVPIEIRCGAWQSTWYGIKPIEPADATIAVSPDT
jgi:hypothetical protein